MYIFILKEMYYYKKSDRVFLGIHNEIVIPPVPDE